MNTFWWVFCIVFALILGAVSTVIWGSFQHEKGYKDGYSNGYKKGANDQYAETYNKRLLRQAQRVSAKEKTHEAATIAGSGSGEVPGSTEPSDRVIGSGTFNVLVDDAHPGADPVSGNVQ